MKIESILAAIDRTRGTGNTTGLAEACSKVDGILVCANERQERQVKRDHGSQATNLYRMDALVGTEPRALFFDDHAVTDICEEAERRWKLVEEARQERDSALRGLEKLREENDRLRTMMEEAEHDEWKAFSDLLAEHPGLFKTEWVRFVLSQMERALSLKPEDIQFRFKEEDHTAKCSDCGKPLTLETAHMMGGETICDDCGLHLRFSGDTDRRKRPTLVVQQTSRDDRIQEHERERRKQHERRQFIMARRKHGLPDLPPDPE